MQRVLTRFGNLPIKKKLVILMISISSLVLILAGTSSMIRDYVAAKERLLEKHVLLAKVVAKNISAAVVFKDSNAATDVLSSIAGIDSVDSILVEASDGALIAKFQNAGSGHPHPSVSHSESGAATAPTMFEGGHLHLHQSITVDGETVGTIHLVANLAELYNELAEDLLIGALVTILLILFSIVAATFLNGVISNPILALTETMQRVSREQDYGVRVPQTSRDEVGVLVQGFNAMLETVEARDEELMTYRQSLEELVDERTGELEKSQRRFIDGIEALPAGFALFDGENRLIVTNSKYREVNDGIKDLISPGVSIQTILKGVMDRGLLDFSGVDAAALQNDLRENLDGVADVKYTTGMVVRRTAKPTREGGTVAVFTDITDLRRTEDELRIAKEQAEAASKSKSEFLANMSHEIRTPMNGVLGMADLLAKAKLGERERRLVQTIRQSGGLLLNIINDILDFSKIEAGKLDIVLRDLDVRSCVEDVGDLLAETANAKGVELIYRVDGDVPPVVKGDGTRLRQILTNLAGNAVKFTSQGEITIRVSAEPPVEKSQRVRFEVRDTGIGIPREEQSQIFDSFQQVDASTSRRFGGTGLGLAIASQLVKMMAGEIGVESEPGKGSTFWFELPFEIGDVARTRVDGEGESLGGLSVLIVDDNAMSRSALLENVKNWGMAAECAESAEEALDMLRARQAGPAPFDVVILDVMMPDNSGIELAKQIRGDKPSADIPLILLSSANIENDDTASIVGPPMAFVTKPARRSALFNQIAQLFEAAWTPARHPEHLETRSEMSTPQITARILVAEDNPINQEVTRENLVTFGCDVDMVDTGAKAIEAWETGSYDLILMDCQMPEMDGFDATGGIRQREEGRDDGRHTPIVALTAHAMETDREQCLAAGMDDYLAKPFHPDDLYAVLRRWILGDPETAADEPPSPDGAPDVDLPDGTGDENRPSGEPVIDRSALDSIRALRREGAPDPLARVITKYLTTTPDELRALQDVTDAGDLDGVRKLAHKLKSGSASLGAARLAGLFRDLEAAAKDGDGAAVPTIVDELNEEFARVADALNEEISDTD